MLSIWRNFGSSDSVQDRKGSAILFSCRLAACPFRRAVRIMCLQEIEKESHHRMAWGEYWCVSGYNGNCWSTKRFLFLIPDQETKLSQSITDMKECRLQLFLNLCGIKQLGRLLKFMFLKQFSRLLNILFTFDLNQLPRQLKTLFQLTVALITVSSLVNTHKLKM